MRLEGLSAALRDAYPDGDAYTQLMVLVSEFGDVALIMVVLSLLYWLTDRRKAAVVASYVVVAASFIILLKAVLGMPRPPEEVLAVPLSDDPYGFPSGHAFITVVVYGGLVRAFGEHRNPLAVGGVVALLVAVSFSRIALGLHYVGDTVAGAFVGVVFLLVLNALVEDRPERGFALGAALAVPTLVYTGGEEVVLVALGGSVGGFVASLRLEDVPALRSRAEGAYLAVLGLVFLVSVTVFESVVVDGNPVGVVAVNAVLVAGIFLAPFAVGRLDERFVRPTRA
ncbi:MAG: phosphatase PAP2 family protein [Halobacteriales archaeon]|nr:phosphatase PAP2 family protein [Halobacteriales archaeon]